MKSLYMSIAICGVFGYSGLRAETVEIPDSESQDHKYQVKIIPPRKPSEMSAIAVVSSTNGKSLGSAPLGGYARYPHNADPMNLAVLWSPSSQYLGLMHRNAKRSWRAVFYSVSNTGLSAIELPSATTQAFKLLGVRKGFRVGRERPYRWINEDSIIVRSSGDATVNGKVIWYEVDVTYSISKQSIIDSKLISTKSHEG